MTKGLHVPRIVESGIHDEIADRLIAAAVQHVGSNALKVCKVGYLSVIDGDNWLLAALVVAPPLFAVVTEGFSSGVYVDVEVDTYRLEDARQVSWSKDRTVVHVATGGTVKEVRLPVGAVALDILPSR